MFSDCFTQLRDEGPVRTDTCRSWNIITLLKFW